MVAYSFQRQFVEPIRADAKLHTIRADRRRHARPGEELQLYCGMRTKGCFLIGRRTCRDVKPILLDLSFQGDRHRGAVYIADKLLRRPLDEFAHSDGFESWDALRAFWREHHPKLVIFQGIIVFWQPGEPK